MENKLKNKKNLTEMNGYEKVLDIQKNSKEEKGLSIKNNENENHKENNEEEINWEDFSKTKINKPIELREFDVTPHFKENIIHSDKNCNDNITETSYYCFTCKHSVCEECGVFSHKEHLLIQRDNCINYDVTFFNEISKVIEDSFLIENKKKIIKKNIIISIDKLKEELDNLKINKLKETDLIFDKIKINLNELKNNYSKAKSDIEDYYSKNKLFFNVSIFNSNSKNEKEKEKEEKININFDDDKIIKNKDIENSIFLMNFELMNLCDNKNLQVLDAINEMKYKVNKLITNIQKTNYIYKELENYLDINSCLIKFDDYYLEVKLRTKKYNEFINKFKSMLNGIIKKNGNLDKLKDLVEIFDSKNKKGKDILFNQDYFKNYNNNNNMNISQVRNNSDKNFKSPQKIIGYSKKVYKKAKNEINSPKSLINKKYNDSSHPNIRCLTFNNNKLKNKRDYRQKGTNSYLTNYKSIKNNIKNYGQSSFIRDNKVKQYTNSFHKANSQLFENCDDIILNQRIIQRFFAYSILDLFSKSFKKDNNNEYNSGKKSASFLANYTERYNRLKEVAKPIIGTNQIQYFDSNSNQITKIYLNLSKIDHGYSVFPFGCRHIFIDNILYIIGGADNCGTPINIVLSYDLSKNILLRLPNLNDDHAYHSIEYLENFDSIILIGGEKSSSCEIMDLDTQKWTRLPYLNYPRSNTNIYYNCVNYDLFVLFGMEGEMTEKNKNSDIIEVLKLNDISKGWIKIDYYRSSGLNIKSNYCITLPFTRDKLLIYGCSSARSNDKKLFAFFNMNKNECIKVDKDTLELIKLEEKKIKFFDFELSKIE